MQTYMKLFLGVKNYWRMVSAKMMKFDREVFNRMFQRTLLQAFCKTIPFLQVIAESFIDGDDNFKSSS